MPISIPQVLIENLVFPEGPRWHGGKLWFSDMHAHEVVTVDLQGNRESIVEVPNQPSVLGWLPDGRVLVVSMTDRKLLRMDPGGLTEAADLSHLATFHYNDMVVDALLCIKHEDVRVQGQVGDLIYPHPRQQTVEQVQ